jgi:hypothetical protein
MKLRDLLIDILLETRLFELSFDRKEAIDKIKSNSHTICLHCIKLLILPNSMHRSHWIKELNDRLDEIDDIRTKPDNDKFQAKFYKKYIWEGFLENPDQIKKTIRKIKSKYKEEFIKDLDSKTVFNFLEAFFDDKICIPLAEDLFQPVTEDDFIINKETE